MSQRANEPKDTVKKAVALEYDKKKSEAPIIVASGQGSMADQILAIAEANNVEVREDADLVQVLEKLDVGSPIPLEAFTAVAEILSYIYQMNGRMKDGKLS